MCDKNENMRIKDELNKIQIDQLHNAISKISAQSFELKKICIITLTAVVTFKTKLDATISLKNLCIYIFLIVILFYITDVFLYGYQRNLRSLMIKEENEIYDRHNISETRNLLKSINKWVNKSHVIYYILLGLCSVVLGYSIFVKDVVSV